MRRACATWRGFMVLCSETCFLFGGVCVVCVCVSSFTSLQLTLAPAAAAVLLVEDPHSCVRSQKKNQSNVNLRWPPPVTVTIRDNDNGD